MAPAWCLPVEQWQRRLRGWLDEPDPRALLDAQVFLDLRPVAGELDVGVLERTLARGRDRTGILLALARSARRFAPRAGRFGRLRTDRLGLAEVKLRGTVPIVMLGRLYGLAAGSRERSTAGRLAAAAAAGLLSADAADTLLEAYAVLLSIRLDRELAELAEDPVPDTALSARQRRQLHSAFRTVRTALQASELTHPNPG
jgi:CBS domain-containing protein